MGEAKFTAGPWKHVPIARDGERLADRIMAGDTVVVTDVLEEVDAHLIAAAPELFKALEQLDRLREGCAPDELGAIAGRQVAAFVEQYRAALRKALGDPS